MTDINLAVGDGSRRMTYAELAAVRGISVASAERLVRRRRWARQVGNDGVVRVLVPLAEARKRKPTALADTAPDNPADIRTSPQTSPLIAPDIPPIIRTLESAVAALREQLAAANARADRAEQQAIEDRRRLIEILSGPRRPWWRRWFRL
jgi:hypothetical protein